MIGELGKNGYKDTFSGLRVIPGANKMVVFATDVDRAAQMVATGRSRVSMAVRDATEVEIKQAKYAKQQLWAARSEIWARSASWAASGTVVHGISARGDGSGLDVYVSDQASAARLDALRPPVAGVAAGDIDVEVRAAPRALSRYNDSPPYWAGTYITNDFSACTSAFGMLRAGKEYLMTADHCFDLNDLIEDGGGDDIGNANIRNIYNDALGIETDAASGVYLTDTVTGFFGRAAWSYNGQLVCHSGYFTAVDTGQCQIQVVDDDFEYTLEGNLRRGVVGWRCDGCAVVDHGDSGGPAWHIASDGILESRGILSAASGEVDGGYEFVYWTETPRILNAFGGSLIAS